MGYPSDLRIVQHERILSFGVYALILREEHISQHRVLLLLPYPLQFIHAGDRMSFG
jgi:hypothetical protein